MTRWTQLGPRERELLTVLRRAGGPLTTRDLLDAIRDHGDDVAYTTAERTLTDSVDRGGRDRPVDRRSRGGGGRHYVCYFLTSSS